ncbi:hypothetical protein BKA56DRAFT_308792 [Ilyonectria sp. MPI-CAGE-AT-0026]|nr:hypothetical protein BKA56DRAFT_308792 [Ilyonectria sp. MPI-CAGE-AT-0026]
MAEAFSKCFPDEDEGHALYQKVLGTDMKPGTCGYFNQLHKWVPIIHTLDNDAVVLANGLQAPQAMPVNRGQDDEWGVRKSGSVSGSQFQVDASASVPGAPGGGVALKFTSTRGQGAVLIPGSKVTESRAEPASAFRKWMSASIEKVLTLPMCDEDVVRDKGLWLITGTFTAKRRALAVLESTGSDISLGLDVTIPGIVRAGPAAAFWKSTEYSTGWIVHTDETNGVVLFASGIYYKPKLMSKEFKAVGKQKSQRWLKARAKRSPIDVQLGESARPGAEYVRLWPCAFGKPVGLDELPRYEESYEESGDELVDEDSESESD